MSNGSKGRAIAPAGGKLGVLLPGMGAVATTFVAGVEAARRGRCGEAVLRATRAQFRQRRRRPAAMARSWITRPAVRL